MYLPGDEGAGELFRNLRDNAAGIGVDWVGARAIQQRAFQLACGNQRRQRESARVRDAISSAPLTARLPSRNT